MSELKVHASACDIEPMVQIEEIRAAFAARLREALLANDIPSWGGGARLAKLAGVTPKASSKWLNGESMPGGAKMLALASALKVRVEWLEYGRGGMRDGDHEAPKPLASQPADIPAFPTEDDEEDAYVHIKQYTALVSAGSGQSNDHVEVRGTLAFKREWIRFMALNPKNLKVIYAQGSSMEPTISDRDVLLIDESRIDPVDGQVFALFSENKGAIVKRLIFSDLEGWIIRSDNPDKALYADLKVPDGEIHEHRILGRVIWRGGVL
ncbi:XRE family transcriptional regulator [Pseudomonas monteilii]|uniref:XRE family transcriptional regulator n=1 Tax=Pseudomonas monteilii TaxID=76759 RepID=UPI0029587309|nr:S24 family peptidase [Pseudomonas monteilii]